MNRIYFSLSILALILITSCDIIPEEEAQVRCLPTNMTVTVIMGSNTTKIIADFHYVPESDLLDHITWSNHQTHYFEYNASGQLAVLRQLKVKEKVQDEYWFSYDGENISEVVLIRKNLDYAYLTPVDSTYMGRIDYEYEGRQIILEAEYEVEKESKKEYLLREVSYTYDNRGNMLSSLSTLYNGSEEESRTDMTYDSGNHPFSGLKYYFTGESFVNNQLTKTSGMMDYSYDVSLNEQNYPESIYEKLGSSNTRIFRYTYMTK